MRKICCLAALLAAIPCIATAQVGKEVEVTKAYVPDVERATKLAAVPDMTDTVKLRPEIDYSITPLSFASQFDTRPIRPAQVTYWEFNRPRPFYLKAGAGYPLNSVLDFYAATQHPGTGYAVGYVNHEGRYADIRNDFGQKRDALRMTNRIGAAAGKYFGRHTLEGSVCYENRLYSRYGACEAAPDAEAGAASVMRPDYGDAELALRFGDDFENLDRWNFDLAFRAGLFWDHSDFSGYRNPARQTDVGASAKLARRFGRHLVQVQGGYDRMAGQKAIDGRVEQLFTGGLRYGDAGGFIDFVAGADYCGDRIRGAAGGNYVIPHARLRFDLGTKALQPFFEADGGVHANDYRSLTRQNPYVFNAFPVRNPDGETDGEGGRAIAVAPLDKSTVSYDFRLGIDGELWRERFTYRLYAGFSIRDDFLYWCSVPVGGEASSADLLGAFAPVAGRLTVTSFGGEAVFRPVSSFRLSLGARCNIYNNEGVWRWEAARCKLANGLPSFEGHAGAEYQGRKVTFGVSVGLQSARSWSVIGRNAAADGFEVRDFEAPFGADLRVHLDWRVGGRVTIFGEGRNLADRPLYRYAFYPEYGANCTVGVKLEF